MEQHAGQHALGDHFLTVLRAYLPEPLGPAELADAVETAIAELQASGMKDMGRVMNAILGKHAGQVDGKELSTLVRTRLLS